MQLNCLFWFKIEQHAEQKSTKLVIHLKILNKKSPKIEESQVFHVHTAFPNAT